MYLAVAHFFCGSFIEVICTVTEEVFYSWLLFNLASFFVSVLTFFFLKVIGSLLACNLKIVTAYLCNKKETGTFLFIFATKGRASVHLRLSSALKCFT